MKIMKKIFLNIAVLLSFASVQCMAHAGIPVVDIPKAAIDAVSQAANIAQYKLTVENLIEQVKQAKATVEAMTGSKGMAGLESELSASLSQYLPDDIKDLQTSLSSQIADIKSGNKLMLPSDTGFEEGSQTMQLFTDSQNQVATNLATGQAAFKAASQHVNPIKSLMGQIDSAPDQKASTDLGNRIAAENALLQNETNKLLALQQTQAAQIELQNQKYIEYSLQVGSGPHKVLPGWGE